MQGFTGTNRCYPTGDPDVMCSATMDDMTFEQNPQGGADLESANNVRSMLYYVHVIYSSLALFCNSYHIRVMN